jgi:hypothetical protein
MAILYRDFAFEWKGKKHIITPSTRLMARIERDLDVSFARVMMDLAMGRPKGFVLFQIWGELLRSAGADVSDDDIAQANEDQHRALSVMLVEMLSDPSEKKDDAPRAPGPKAKKKPGLTGGATT